MPASDRKNGAFLTKQVGSTSGIRQLTQRAWISPLFGSKYFPRKFERSPSHDADNVFLTMFEQLCCDQGYQITFCPRTIWSTTIARIGPWYKNQTDVTECLWRNGSEETVQHCDACFASTCWRPENLVPSAWAAILNSKLTSTANWGDIFWTVKDDVPSTLRIMLSSWKIKDSWCCCLDRSRVTGASVMNVLV